MAEILANSYPDYIDLFQEILAMLSGFLAGGVLVSVIGWSIGYAVYTAFHWLTSWTR